MVVLPFLRPTVFSQLVLLLALIFQQLAVSESILTFSITVGYLQGFDIVNMEPYVDLTGSTSYLMISTEHGMVKPQIHYQ